MRKQFGAKLEDGRLVTGYYASRYGDHFGAFQIYVPPAGQLVHPNCLHLWKPPYAVELPPEILVGVKDAGIVETMAQVEALRRAGL